VEVTYELKVDMPNLSSGQSVAIGGLGVFEQGKTYVISDEDHARWRSFNTAAVDEVDDKGVPTGRVVPRDPGTLLVAYKNVQGITITTASKDATGPSPEGTPPPAVPPVEEGGK
jgi:hypothetical protein